METFESSLNEYHSSLKCESCKSNPGESYFNGKCEHLFCKKCITSTNKCNLCQITYTKRDINLNIELQQAINYVNKLMKIINNDDDTRDHDDDDNKENRSENNENEKTVLLGDDGSKADDDKKPNVEEIDFSLTQKNEKSRAKKSSDVIFKPNAKKVKMEEDTILDVTELNVDNEKEKQTKGKKNKNSKNQTTTTNNNPSTTLSIMQNFNKKQKKNEKGETALHLAVIAGDFDACKRLLEEGCDPNSRDYAGWTPLHEACEHGYLDIIRLLVENNASVNAKGFKDSTPLHECVLNEHLNCIKYLLENGADVTIRNSHGFTPKEFASRDPKMYHLFETIESKIPIQHQSQEIEENTQRANMSFGAYGLSQFDTTTTRRKRSDAKSKRFIIFGTGMSEEDKVKLNNLANKLDIKLQKEMSPNVTHVIFKDAAVCQRTINFMKAVLMGIWIVSIKWLEDSAVEGKLLEENKYECTGSHKNPQTKAPFKGRMNACLQNPNLFDGCHFYFYGEFDVFNKNDLIQLVKLGDGIMLRREPRLDRLDELITEKAYHSTKDNDFKCTHFIVYDSTKPRELIQNPYLYTVNVNWIFNCIDNFKIYVDNSNTKQ